MLDRYRLVSEHTHRFQLSGPKFLVDFLPKIEIAFHRLLNILCAVSGDDKSPHEWEKIERK